MGRRRQHDIGLPEYMYCRAGRYYYGRNHVALGGNLAEALRKYAELHTGEAGPGTFAEAADRYKRDELPKKAAKTQIEYRRQLATLVLAFGAMRLDEITPGDVADFMRTRATKVPADKGAPRGGKIVATREKALLSAVISFARESHLYDGQNPCAGIQGTKSRRTRDAVTDEELADAIRRAIARGDAVLAGFLELCYRTGQRPGDVARLRRQNVQGDVLTVVQAKTKAKVRIDLVGPLAELVERLQRPITAHAGKVSSMALIRDEEGQPLTLGALRKRFEKLDCDWWFMDLRAKAATDTADALSNRHAQKLLGHASATTTDNYIRQRAGDRATPPMRKVKE